MLNKDLTAFWYVYSSSTFILISVNGIFIPHHALGNLLFTEIGITYIIFNKSHFLSQVSWWARKNYFKDTLHPIRIITSHKNNEQCHFRGSIHDNFLARHVSLFVISLFHLRWCFRDPWTPCEAAVWGRHCERTPWGVGVEEVSHRSYAAAGKGSLCRRIPDKSFLLQDTGGGTSWALLRWLSDHLQLWGWRQGVVSVWEPISTSVDWALHL